ncbi:hypothetical protein BH23ACT12_BH23ACT12_20590 [soil metagenome]
MSRFRRRLGAAICGILLAALWAGPAGAMTGTRFTAPSPSEGIDGTTTIRVESEPEGLFGENISVSVTITPPAGGGSATTMALAKKSESVFEGSWNAGAVPLNGAYRLDAVATSSGVLGGRRDEASMTALVNNAPKAPTGVKAVLKDGVPTITWAANPEKDITAYKVVRFVDGGSPSQVYAGAATSTKDTSAPHSKALTYRVTAVRKSPVTTVIESAPAATSPVTVPAPPEPETPAGEPAGEVDPNKPTIPGTNIVTGKETPKAAIAPNKSFGKAIAPIVKSAPAGTSFEETLPYSGVPPEQFEAAAGGDPFPLDAMADSAEGVTVTNPIKFIVGGILLLVASFFMWRKSRQMLKGTRPQDQIAPTRVNFPTFRINRG